MTDEINEEEMSSLQLKHQSSTTPSATSKWDMLGSKVPKTEVVYFSQIFILLIIILACILNLSVPSLRSAENAAPIELWIILLSTCIGCILPTPKLKSSKSQPSRQSPVLPGNTDVVVY